MRSCGVRASSCADPIITSGRCSAPCAEPQVEQPSTSRCTTCGWFRTSSWAIIPPIDIPSTWARWMPSSRRRPAASSAMRRIVTSPAGLSVCPVPRLEKRMTRK